MNALATIEPVRNVENEAVLLGAMIFDNRWIDRAADKLTPDDFFEAVHGRIFSAIVREYSQGRTVTVVTLKPYLQDDPALNELGGISYLAKLSGNGAVTLLADTSIDQIREMARRRRLIDGLNHAAMLAADMSVSNEEVIEVADAAVAPTSDLGEGVVQISAAKAFEEMLASYDEPTNGVTCGRIPALDERLGPIRKHHLVVVGGRPGMGKTAFALSYAVGAASNGHGVLFVSLEMARGELMQRATADVCFDGHRVPYHVIRDGSFESRADKEAIYRAGHTFRELPLHILDAGSLTVGRLNMIVRRYKRRMAAAGQKLELVVIDYLQLLKSDHRNDSQYQTITEVSKALKAIAKTHDVGVMALAQLSRDVEKREDKRPVLSDLRDSGQIEQDADAVVFLYREHYYLKQGLPRENHPKYQDVLDGMAEVENEIDLIVAKRRNGSTGAVHAFYSTVYQAMRGRP